LLSWVINLESEELAIGCEAVSTTSANRKKIGAAKILVFINQVLVCIKIQKIGRWSKLATPQNKKALAKSQGLILLSGGQDCPRCARALRGGLNQEADSLRS
jgi:hypothetical protein